MQSHSPAKRIWRTTRPLSDRGSRAELSLAKLECGGLIRDVLVGRPTLLLSRDLYAIPVLIGCVVMALILAVAPEYQVHGSIVCMIVTFGIRAAAIRWDLQVPEWATIGFTTKQGQS